jgi:hypothetical protein
MKESWMEKLIELLNEYEIEKEKSEWVNVDAYVEFKWDYNNNWLARYDETDRWEWDNLYWDTSVAYLISKKFGFIKWLVDNDKIDLWQKLFNLTKNDSRKSTICDLDNNDFSWEDTFLMLLSISDEPIRFLCEILK